MAAALTLRRAIGRANGLEIVDNIDLTPRNNPILLVEASDGNNWLAVHIPDNTLVGAARGANLVRFLEQVHPDELDDAINNRAAPPVPDVKVSVAGTRGFIWFYLNDDVRGISSTELDALGPAPADDVLATLREYNTLYTPEDGIAAAIRARNRAQGTAAVFAVGGGAVGGGAVAVAGAGARERPRPAVVRRFRAAVGNDNVQTFNGLRTVQQAVDVAETFIGTGDDADNARQFVPDLFAKVTKAAYDRMKQDVVANAGQITAWKELAVAATEGSPLAGYARLFTPTEVNRLVETDGGSMTPGDGVAAAGRPNNAYRVLERLYVKGNKIVIHARRPYVWKKKHYDFLDLPTETGAHPKFVSCINEIGLTAEEIRILTGNHAVATPLVILKYYILRTHPYFKRWMRDQGRATRVQNQVRKARGVAESKRGEVYAKVAAKIGTRTNAVKRATNKALRGVFAATKRQRTDVATCAMAV